VKLSSKKGKQGVGDEEREFVRSLTFGPTDWCCSAGTEILHAICPSIPNFHGSDLLLWGEKHENRSMAIERVLNPGSNIDKLQSSLPIRIAFCYR